MCVWVFGFWCVYVCVFDVGVCVYNKLSKWDKINIGDSQGSVLGPLISLIYINDLPSIIPCTLSNKNPSVILFADDTSVIINELCLTILKVICI